SLVKLPLFIREGDKKDLEILFSSNKPVYVDANIITRLGQNGKVIEDKEFKTQTPQKNRE
ncbi:MAG: hypothetical protein Q8N79_07405, partial [Candidatus Methanoperedens sp.]|nr:hypothetical protein [Candidatus Methanoperedens sp.]